MKVRITFEVDDEDRRAIAWQTEGDADHYPMAKASHESVRAWIRKTVRADLESIRARADFQDAAAQVGEYELEGSNA